jgi:hypothetical protein
MAALISMSKASFSMVYPLVAGSFSFSYAVSRLSRDLMFRDTIYLGLGWPVCPWFCKTGSYRIQVEPACVSWHVFRGWRLRALPALMSLQELNYYNHCETGTRSGLTA